MKALVTGGSGFLGRYLVERLLADGVETRTFCRRPSDELRRLGVDERLGDLRSFEDVAAAVEGCDVVFHVAAFPSVVMDPRPYYETNVLGAKNVVAACLAKRARRLVYTSTQCVANTIESQEGVDESTPYAPRFLGWYQMTKAIAEQFVRAANYAPWTDDYDFGGVDLSETRFRSLSTKFNIERPQRDPYREDALMTVALRPHLIWGPRDRHLVPRLVRRARNGKLRRVGDGKNRLATIYVANCADAHKLACDALRLAGGAAKLLEMDRRSARARRRTARKEVDLLRDRLETRNDSRKGLRPTPPQNGTDHDAIPRDSAREILLVRHVARATRTRIHPENIHSRRHATPPRRSARARFITSSREIQAPSAFVRKKKKIPFFTLAQLPKRRKKGTIL